MNTRTNTFRPSMLLAGFLVVMASILTTSSTGYAQTCCRVIINNNSACTVGACVSTPAGRRCFFVTAGTSDTLNLPGCPTISNAQINDACGNPIPLPLVAGTCIRIPVKDPATGTICCVDICYRGSCVWDIDPAAGPCGVC